MKSPTVLIIDDEPLMRLSMEDALRAVGCDVRAAATGSEGLAMLDQAASDIVVTDLRLPGIDGLTLLQAAKQRSSRTEVVVITAHGSVETAVGAMKAGAYDYITKPFSMDELLLIVERIGKVLALRQENLLLREELEGKFNFEGILGKNERMREVLDKVKLVAQCDSPQQPATRPGADQDQLRRAARNPPGSRALWAREGRVYRRAEATPRPVRAGPQGDAVPG